jgi:hypothetical protein
VASGVTNREKQKQKKKKKKKTLGALDDHQFLILICFVEIARILDK